jgi:hypothetical protein
MLLGVASLDLSSLALLGCVDGWYNIVDAHQQTRGQIKVGWACTVVKGHKRRGMGVCMSATHAWLSHTRPCALASAHKHCLDALPALHQQFLEVAE